MNPSMLLGLPLLCRCVTQLARGSQGLNTQLKRTRSDPEAGLRQALETLGPSDAVANK